MAATLAEQLRSYAERSRLYPARIRQIVQLTAFLFGEDPERAADEARRETLRWLHRRAGPLPDQAWQGDSFEREVVPGHSAFAVSLTDPAPYWVARLDREAATWEALALEETEARAHLQDETHQLRAQNDWLRSELDRLRDAVQKLTGTRADAPIPFPGSLAEVGEWAHQAVPGRLIVLPRAIRAAKRSVYGKPEQVYWALLALANEYRDMRAEGGFGKRAVFEKTLEELGLRCEPTFSGVGYGEFGDTYFVVWGGERRLLDMHLKNGGNTRDPTKCLRIYFFWDAEEEQVVVGSLPGHLESRFS